MARSIAGTSLLSYLDTNTGLIINATIPSGTIPTTASLYAPAATVIDLSTGITYRNAGTTASPSFQNEDEISTGEIANAAVTSAKIDPTVVQVIEVDLTAADIIDTAAGKLSHANGLIVVPAPATGYYNVFHSATVSYTFATAAFTGGGNTTISIGGGGAALSGLIATTTLWQNASSIIQQFVPLSTVAFPITKETSINLKTASAITNPGTAAGTAKVRVHYSVHAI